MAYDDQMRHVFALFREGKEAEADEYMSAVQWLRENHDNWVRSTPIDTMPKASFNRRDDEGSLIMEPLAIPQGFNVARLRRKMKAEASYGCDCSHCNAGWDCCGRWMLVHLDVRPIRQKGAKHAIGVYSFARNV